MNQLADQSVRQQALDPGQSFIVQAPAGSGKTELLIQRYLVLLSHVQHHPEEVLAITFTRKAAQEMRHRLITTLQDAREGSDCAAHQQQTRAMALKVLDKDRQCQWGLCENPHRLRIMTIDALCSSLVKRMPLLSKMGGNARISADAAHLYQQAALATITQHYADHAINQSLQSLLLHLDNRLELVQRLLCDLLSKREQWLPFIIEAGRADDCRTYLQANLEQLILEQLQHCHNQLQSYPEIQDLINNIRNAANYCASTSPDNPIAACAELTSLPEPRLAALAQWRGLVDILLKADNGFRQSVNVKQGFPAASQFKTIDEKNFWRDCKKMFQEQLRELAETPELAEQLAILKLIPDPHYSDEQWQVIEALMILLPVAAAQLMVVFQQRGEVDFNQISLAALTALGDDQAPTDLALALDQSIQHLLVDEFQDTSVSHCQLINALTQAWQPGDGKTLFVVGDPMQSIYRFRQARVDLFIQAKQMGLGSVPLTPLTLTVNFRSSKTIVDWNNRLFKAMFPAEDDLDSSAIAYSSSSAFSSDTENCFVQTHFSDSDSPRADKQLLALIQNCKRQHPNQNIAVLVRSRSHLQSTLALLRSHNIVYHAGDIEPLIEQPAIQDCLALTLALNHYADQIAWLSVFRAPWCGLTLIDLHHIAQHKPNRLFIENALDYQNINPLSDDAKVRLQWLMPILQATIKQRQNLPLSQRVRLAWQSLLGKSSLVSPEQVSICQHYFHLLEVYCQQKSLFDPFDFQEHLSKQYLPHPKHEQQPDSPIEIMTIHKSKGLEFDIVIIPGLERASRASQRTLLSWCERLNGQQQQQITLAPIQATNSQDNQLVQFISYFNKVKDRFELMRLFYVGCTRAKQQLHLMATLPDSRRPNKSSLLSLCWQHLSASESECHPVAVDETGQVPQLSANQLRRFAKQFYAQHSCKPNTTAQPAQTYQPLVPGSQDAAIVGTLIHEVCQRLGEQKLSLATLPTIDSEYYWRQRLLSEGIHHDKLEQHVSTLQQALTNLKQSARASWIFSTEHSFRQFEYAITARHESGLEHHRIDCILTDTDEITWIIDFKTARPATKQTLTDFLAEQQLLYQAQLDNYAKIINGMFTDTCYCGIYFVCCDAWVEWQPDLILG